MTILIFAIIVVIVAFLLIYAVDSVPGMPAPMPVIFKVAIVLIAALIIMNRAGLV